MDAAAVRAMLRQHASLQLRFRLGYEWSERDEHDLRRLIDRFEIPHPPPLRRRPV